VQCDLWFPPRKPRLEDGSRTLVPVVVMASAYSRFTLGWMIPTRNTEDLLLGSWDLLTKLGRVPRRLIWDNESGIGQRTLTEPATVSAGTLATNVAPLRPRESEYKGVVERRNGWSETSFMCPFPRSRAWLSWTSVIDTGDLADYARVIASHEASIGIEFSPGPPPLLPLPAEGSTRLCLKSVASTTTPG
jgi:hypothetical protein